MLLSLFSRSIHGLRGVGAGRCRAPVGCRTVAGGAGKRECEGTYGQYSSVPHASLLVSHDPLVLEQENRQIGASPAASIRFAYLGYHPAAYSLFSLQRG